MLDNEHHIPDTKRDTAQPKKPKSRRAYMRAYQKKLRQKRKRLELSLDPDDYVRLKKEADRHGMKLATFTREAVFAYLNQEFILPNPEQVRELELAFRQIGNNISQIAHHAKNHRDAPIDLNTVGRLLAELEDEITQTLRHPERQ